MRGSVIKRGKSWSVVVELPPDPETGKRRQRWHSGYRTRKEAERARIELLSIVDSGHLCRPQPRDTGGVHCRLAPRHRADDSSRDPSLL